MKLVFVDFFINVGIKFIFVVSYNYFGNNDGKNLSEQRQFCFKEIFKFNVIDDMVEVNIVFYVFGEKFDYIVVIKYMFVVGDDKCVFDEYYVEIFFGGYQIILFFNVCEDFFFVFFLIIDLVFIIEFFICIWWKVVFIDGVVIKDFEGFYSVFFVFFYMFKVFLIFFGIFVVNVFVKQCFVFVNIMCGCLGFQFEFDMIFEYKFF